MSPKDSQDTTRHGSEWGHPKRRNLTIICNKLRIDPNDGTAVEEYRIENDGVERRILSASGCPSVDSRWQRLLPEQLASHIMASTVVAHWLERRMGIHGLIRACNQRSSEIRDAGLPCHSPEPVTGAGFGPLLPNRAQSDPGQFARQ